MVTIAVGVLMVLAVGAGRVVLNVHYPSNVLAGWALGYLCFLTCLLAIRPVPPGAEARAWQEPPISHAPVAERREAPGSGR